MGSTAVGTDWVPRVSVDVGAGVLAGAGAWSEQAESVSVAHLGKLKHPGHPGPVRTVVKNLRRKLGEGAHNPTYILNEPRIGYRMPRAATAV